MESQNAEAVDGLTACENVRPLVVIPESMPKDEALEVLRENGVKIRSDAYVCAPCSRCQHLRELDAIVKGRSCTDAKNTRGRIHFAECTFCGWKWKETETVEEYRRRKGLE
jgi:hypothetical protein